MRDKHTIEFKLTEPRPPNFIMSGFASGWNVIVRKKTLEDNQYNLRRVVDIPGTGPFKSKRRVDKEVWVMERNPNYWNKGVPYLDGIEFYHGLPFSPELGSAVLSGRTDYARIVDPVSVAQGQGDAGHVLAQLLPERDPGRLGPMPRRSRSTIRACGAPCTWCSSGPCWSTWSRTWRPCWWAASSIRSPSSPRRSTELAKRPGYQTDPTAAIKEAKALLAAAGYKGGAPLDFLVRDVATFKLWAQAIQAMLQQGLGHRMQAAHRGGIGVVRRHQVGQLRHGGRRHRLDAAGSVRLFQCLVQQGWPAELLGVGQRRVQRAAAADRPRGGRCQAHGL